MSVILFMILAGAILSQDSKVTISSRTDCDTYVDCIPFCSHFPGSSPICVRHICGCIVPKNSNVGKKHINSESFVHS